MTVQNLAQSFIYAAYPQVSGVAEKMHEFPTELVVFGRLTPVTPACQLARPDSGPSCRSRDACRGSAVPLPQFASHFMRIHAAHRLLPAFTETMINAILSPSNFTVQTTTSCFQISHSSDQSFC